MDPGEVRSQIITILKDRGRITYEDLISLTGCDGEQVRSICDSLLDEHLVEDIENFGIKATQTLLELSEESCIQLDTEKSFPVTDPAAIQPSSIFLSYARSDDEPFTRRLYVDLTEKGFDIWFDRENMPSRGLKFLHEIRDAITERDRLILVVGPGAVQSDYVSAEWRYALEIGKGINPVLRLGDCPIIPEELKLLDTPDFRDDSFYDARLKTLIRQVSQPLAPMGKLIGVPSLPPHLLKQPERLSALKDAVLADLNRPVVVTGTKARTGIQGMGGIGKSVLASMLAWDHEVRRSFPDGVIWVPIGQEPSIITILRSLLRDLGYSDIVETVSEGKERLRELFTNKAVLIILDDLWEGSHAKAFDVLGPRCRMIVTTRDAGLITSLGGTQYQVQLLTDLQASALLAEWADIPLESLPPAAIEVIHECGNLPLAISICGALAREGTNWTDILEALHEADLTYLDHPHGNILKSIKASVDRLTNEEQERLSELIVFPADEAVPEQAVVTLWKHTGQMTERNARKLLTTLSRRALVRLDLVAGAVEGESERRVSLHDLIRDYLMMNTRNPALVHQDLVDAYSSLSPEGWATGPDDGYFLQHLTSHLITTGKWKEAEDLLLDPRWLNRKIELGMIQGLIEEYDPIKGNNRPLFLIQGALRLSSQVLSDYPAQFSTQMFGRLLGFEEPGIKEFLDRVAKEQKGPWLRPLHQAFEAPGGALIRTLTGHNFEALSVAVSPDGKTAISGSLDCTVRMWNLDSGETIRILEGHTGGVYSVAFSPDDKTAISGSGDNTVRMWNLDTGKTIRIMKGHTDTVSSVAVSPDGKTAISGSWDNTVRMWNLDSGETIRIMEGHTDCVESVAVSPDGKTAISGSLDNTVRMWNLDSGETISIMEGHTNIVHSVAVS
ncbi:MAG: TIR domain-containing protein, partial [Methanospirillaceae archaeon]|nr:TIR domain-containing protein [Methanospirillaceae archaeon]